MTLHSHQRTARECYAASLRIPPPTPSRKPEVHQVTIMNDLDPRPNDEPRVEPREETISWQMSQPGQDTRLGSTLNEEEKGIITAILARNSDLFAWTTTDIPVIDPRIISHKLTICKEEKPIAQKKRRMGEYKRLIAEQEVHKLLDAWFIWEIHYTTWLANIVLVQKNNGK